jgi:hypothetical protein
MQIVDHSLDQAMLDHELIGGQHLAFLSVGALHNPIPLSAAQA